MDHSFLLVYTKAHMLLRLQDLIMRFLFLHDEGLAHEIKDIDPSGR